MDIPTTGSIEWAIQQVRSGKKVVSINESYMDIVSKGGYTEGFNVNGKDFFR